MNARLRWFSGWWGHPPTHYIFFHSSVHYLAVRVQRLNASSLFIWRERMTAHSQAATTRRQPPCYSHHWLNTDTPLSDKLAEKGSTHSGFQKCKVNLICSAVELRNDSEEDASCIAENLEFLHLYSKGTVCRLGRVLCFPVQTQGISKPMFEDSHL